MTSNNPEPAWGASLGQVRIDPPADSPDAPAIQARIMIGETIHRYCWAYDERNESLMRDCFMVDATFAGSIGGRVEIPGLAGGEAITRSLKTIWQSQSDQRRHLVMNTVIDELRGDRARASSMVLVMATADGISSVKTSGFYTFGFSRCGGVWKINEMFVGLDTNF